MSMTSFKLFKKINLDDAKKKKKAINTPCIKSMNENLGPEPKISRQMSADSTSSSIALPNIGNTEINKQICCSQIIG